MTRGKLAALLVACAAPMLAHGQVFKCVDTKGRVSYQSTPCPDAPTERKLDINLGPRNDAGGAAAPDPWAEQVAKKVVVNGMPRATVARAVGSPTVMRAGTPADDAAEVWIYRRGEAERRIGFRNGVVAWVQEGMGDLTPPPVRVSRREIVRGRSCGDLLRDLGPADTIVSVEDAELARPLMRYVFPSSPPDNETTTVFCDDGVVARVDRVLDR